MQDIRSYTSGSMPRKRNPGLIMQDRMAAYVVGLAEVVV
jgi:hypothetical protein